MKIPRGADPKAIEMNGGNDAFLFAAQSRKAYFNERLLWLNAPLRRTWGKWALSESDALRVIDPLARPDQHLSEYRFRRIVIDPGHGGKDNGGQGSRNMEKTVVMDIARRLMSRFSDTELEIKLTRTDDQYIPLVERSRKAARWKADLFISIHANVVGSPNARGIETYILPAPGYPSTSDPAAKYGRMDELPSSRNDKASVVLAYEIHNALLKNTGAPDRGIKHARFVVLKEAPCPAVLVECGFLSNPEEEKMLSTAEYRDKIADALEQGILSYVRAGLRAVANHTRMAKKKEISIKKPFHRKQ